VSEPIIIKGRPSFGIAMNLAYGLVCFIFGLGLFIGEYKTSDYCWLAFFLFLIIFGAILLSKAIYEAKLRTLEIDDNGVRFRIGNRLDWNVPWGEMRCIGTDSMSGRYPRIGFFVGTEKNRYHINNRDDFGPKEKLVEAFRVIASKAAGPNVVCDDLLGWATDLQFKFGLPKAEIEAKKFECERSALEGKWYNSTKPFVGLKFFLGAACVCFILGAFPILVQVLWLPKLMIGKFDGLTLGGCLIAAGIFCMIVGLSLYLASPIAVRFNPDTISLRYPSGRITESSWEKVKNLGISTSTGALTIFFPGDKYLREGFFDPKVVEAIRILYSRRKERKDEPLRPH
jgi:hypothetical protein